jgi:hypothetical protein
VVSAGVARMARAGSICLRVPRWSVLELVMLAVYARAGGRSARVCQLIVCSPLPSCFPLTIFPQTLSGVLCTVVSSRCARLAFLVPKLT